MIYDYKVLLIGLLVCMAIAIISLLTIAIILIYYFRNEIKIKKAVYDLGADLTDDKVRSFGNLINNIKIPDRASNWKTIRAGYEIINMNTNIDEALKKDIKVILLCKEF